MRTSTKALLAVVLAAATAAAAVPAAAQTPPPARPPRLGAPTTDVRRTPVLVRADEMRYEQELGLVIAKGNVEITQADRTLLADAVTYDQKNDIVTASGSVSLLEPSGDVIFSDFVEITGDLKDGVIDNLRMRMANNVRVAAAGARRYGGTRTEMDKGVYSACDACKDDPQAPPLWQVKARKIVHDTETHEVTYNDAWLELYGTPVLYTPYLSHTDPTVRQASGFLMPTIGHDSSLGMFARTPYYYAISPSQDATVTPMWMTNRGVLVAGQYRERFAHGLLSSTGSITEGRNDEDKAVTRGHLDLQSRFDFDEAWRGGLKYVYASDDTFLRRYGFPAPSTLVSRAYTEGFNGRNYASAQAYHFQGQAIGDVPGLTPIVAPLLDYNFVGEPGWNDGRFSLDGNLATISRTQGADMRRVSAKAGWQLPYTSDWGERYTFFATTQADGYWVDNLASPSDPNNTLSGATGRFFPQTGLEWSLPLVRSGSRGSDLIEPVAGAFFGPNLAQNNKIPNEDSRDLELDDTNLLRPNRFSGIDRLEGGARFDYGMRTATYFPVGQMSGFVGQSYRPRKDSDFAQGSGLTDHFSDVVGRVDLKPMDEVNLLYRFRLDKSDLSPKRTEIGTILGPRALNLRVDYVNLDRLSGANEFANEREEITVYVSSHVTDYWTLGARTQRNIQAGEQIYDGVRVAYEDECVLFSIDYVHTFTSDRDVRPSDRYLFRFVLKTIGAFETGA